MARPPPVMPLLVSGDPHSRVPQYPTPNHCRYIVASLPPPWCPPRAPPSPLHIYSFTSWLVTPPPSPLYSHSVAHLSWTRLPPTTNIAWTTPNMLELLQIQPRLGCATKGKSIPRFYYLVGKSSYDAFIWLLWDALVYNVVAYLYQKLLTFIHITNPRHERKMLGIHPYFPTVRLVVSSTHRFVHNCWLVFIIYHINKNKSQTHTYIFWWMIFLFTWDFDVHSLFTPNMAL